MKRTLGFVAIPVTFALGAWIARASLAFAPASTLRGRAQPLPVVTAWGAYGASAFAILAACLIAATVALVIAVRSTPAASDGRDERNDVWFLFAIAAASALACCAWPFAFSSDVYAYAAYGDLATRGVTPYALAPSALHDAILDGARFQWSGAFPPCVYGPAFVALAAALVWIARAAALDAAGTLALFRACAVLAFLGTIVCARTVLAPLPPRERRAALALGALNPVVLWSVAEGHNDVYAMLAVAAILAFARRENDLRRQVLVPLALLVKATAGPAVVALALQAIVARRHAAGPIAIATLAGTVVAAALILPPLVPALQGIAAHGRYAPSVSLPGAIGLGPAIAIAVAFALVAVAVLGHGKRGGYAWLGLAAFAAIPNPYPWYGVVLVPLAVAGGGNPASIGLYAVTICAAMRYLPDAFGDMTPGAALAASAVVVAPIAFALTGLRDDLRPEKERQTP